MSNNRHKDNGYNEFIPYCVCQTQDIKIMATVSGGRGSSAVERATPGEEVPGSIPAVAARSLQAGSVSV